jgi:ADP-dependent NAD(P)H-hydrate dehydratase / NAD(P)H-hydrate epimerase
MKVLTAAQMREVDRRTVELGIPGLVLMENAGHRVVEFLQEQFAPLRAQRVVVFCGKGNNGGDGLVIARQIHTRGLAASLHVVLAAQPEELRGDAAENFRMYRVVDGPLSYEILPEMRMATIVVDALLGTGLRGATSGHMLELIREINSGFPLARTVAVDLPSGLSSDCGTPQDESVQAHSTVTFTAPKPAHVLPPNCARVGTLRVAAIGSPAALYEADDSVFLSLSEAHDFAALLAPRDPGGHKGAYGHALVIAGSPGKTGAAALCGFAALRSGAGLVTVASTEAALPSIAAFAPELMTERLPAMSENKDVIAIGPGLGKSEEMQALIRRVVCEFPQPVVIDADALAAMPLACAGKIRILTPHPGEMSRLTGRSTAEIQADRIGAARTFAMEHKVTLVLKGWRTVIAFPDGRVWINPTGTPAMGKGGSGDVLTGMIAGFLAQFPEDTETALRAAVYLHGLAGELAAARLGDKCVLATDLLEYLPEAMRACTSLTN